MMYVRFPLSLRNVEDLLFERGTDISHETVRQWWNRFGLLFAGDIRRGRMIRMRAYRQWRWHLDELYVRLSGEMVYLWRAVDHEGEVLERCVTHTRDKDAALRFVKTALESYGSCAASTTDGLRLYGAARGPAASPTASIDDGRIQHQAKQFELRKMTNEATRDGETRDGSLRQEKTCV